jgi:hypothetical protein
MLNLGTPILYIGPKPSHVMAMLEFENKGAGDGSQEAPLFAWVEHGQTDLVVKQIQLARAAHSSRSRNSAHPRAAHFAQDRVLSQLIGELESVRTAK